MVLFFIGCVVGFIFYRLYLKVRNKAYRLTALQIEEMTMQRIAYVKSDIERDIRLSFWQGAISRRQKMKLENLLKNKYTDIMNKWEAEEQKKADEAYYQMLKKYDK